MSEEAASDTFHSVASYPQFIGVSEIISSNRFPRHLTRATTIL
jgi:hypothetical protein